MPTKIQARGAWDYGTFDDLPPAVFDDGSISIDWPPVEGAISHTKLTKLRGARYTGRTVWAKGTSYEDTATVEATLYSSDEGHVIVGEEVWRSGKIDWFVVQLSHETGAGA